jgi:hypothetical protein
MHEHEKKIKSLPDLFKILFAQFSKQNNPRSLSTFHTTFSGSTVPRHQIISHFIDTAAELYGFNHFTFHFPKAMPPTGIAEYKLSVPSATAAAAPLHCLSHSHHNHHQPQSITSISLFWDHNNTTTAAGNSSHERIDNCCSSHVDGDADHSC